MVQVSYPGVYIQEVSSGVHTVTGVATSVAAFFGRTAKGKANKAVRCLSMSDFLREFEGGHAGSELGQSVKMFFDNGGTDCYVIRIAHGAKSSSLTLKSAGKTDVLTATAKSEGKWGDGIRLEVDNNTLNADDTFNLKISYEQDGKTVDSEYLTGLSMDPNSPRNAPGYVSLNSKYIDLSYANGFKIDTAAVQKGYSEGRRPLSDVTAELRELIYTEKLSLFNISVNGSQFVAVDLSAGDEIVSTGDKDATAKAIEGKINDRLATVGNSVSCSIETVGTGTNARYLVKIESKDSPNTSVKVQKSLSNDIAGPLMLGVDQGGVEFVRFSDFRPVPTADFVGDFASVNKLMLQDQGAFNALTWGEAGKSVDFGSTLKMNTSASKALWYYDDAGGFDGVRKKLKVIANTVNNTPGLPFRAEVWGYHLAFIQLDGRANKLDLKTSGGNAVNIGTGGLQVFTNNVRQYDPAKTGNSDYQDTGNTGVDENGNLALSDYTGDVLQQTGFYALDTVDLFNLMVLPLDTDLSIADYRALYSAACIYCESRRAFLIMDAPDDWAANGKMNDPASKVGDLRNAVVKYQSAAYYPKIVYSDGGLMKTMGPSGAIAGLMARTDSSRGVWKAPAGVEASIKGALDLEVTLTDNQNGVLNKQGINCIRKFPDGIVCWGARTMDGFDDNSSSDWKYIPIRRLTLFLEESLYRGTKWVVFEPNDEPLWAKIRLNLNAFMMSQFRQGAFQGSTPDKAFYVKCDGETTTQDDRNKGIVNIEVGFAPLKPAEFVVIKLQQMAGDLG